MAAKLKMYRYFPPKSIHFNNRKSFNDYCFDVKIN